MKYLGLLAVLAAGFVGISGDTAQAMPVKLSFSGSILGPSECSAIGRICDSELYEPSSGGIFASGQTVNGSIIYDPSALFGTIVNADGSVRYINVVYSLQFSVDTNSGSYSTVFPGLEMPTFGTALICSEPACQSPLGSQFVSFGETNPNPFVSPPPVAGAVLISATLGFLNSDDLLSSSALLPSEEMLSVIQRSEGLFGLFLIGSEICSKPSFCTVLAKVSLSVAEPDGGAVLGIGLIGMIALRRRKRTAA